MVVCPVLPEQPAHPGKFRQTRQEELEALDSEEEAKLERHLIAAYLPVELL